MLSYSGLKTNKHVTFENIEEWNGRTSIVKNPPQSVMTRHKPKVGQDNSLLDMVDDSGDRFQQFISVYPKGVNQMVSVNYGNSLSESTGTYSKLPYKIMDGGAFRPPIIRQEDLLPLSRLPRISFNIDSMKLINDSSKITAEEWVDVNSALVENTLSHDIETKKSYNLSKQDDKTLHLTSMLPNVNADSNKTAGIRDVGVLYNKDAEVNPRYIQTTLDVSTNANQTYPLDTPVEQYVMVHDKISTSAIANKNSVNYKQQSQISSEMHGINMLKLVNPITADANLAKSFTKYVKPTSEIKVKAKDAMVLSTETFKSKKSNGIDMMNSEYILDRNIPKMSLKTNSTRKAYTIGDHKSNVGISDRPVSKFSYDDRQTFK